MLLLLIVAGITYILISRNISTNIIKQQITNNLVNTTQSRVKHIETLLNLEKEAVKQLSESVVIEELLLSKKDEEDYLLKFDKVVRRLKDTAQMGEYTYDVFVLNPKGTIIASSDEEDIGKGKSNDPYFLGGKERVFIKDAYISSHKQRKTLAFSAPILNKEDNGFLGVVVLRKSLEVLSQITTDRTGLGETGEVYLVNKDGYMITPSRFIDEVFLKQKIDPKHTEEAGDIKYFSTSLKGMIDIHIDYRGIEVLSVHTHIPEMDWSIFAEIDTKEVFAPVTQLTYTLLLIFVIILFISIFVSSFTSKTITGPLRRLHEGTEEITKGNLDFKVGTPSSDEVGQLSRAFDEMTANLKESKQQLENYSRNLEKKVEERTGELSDINQNLKKEITKRKQIEETLRKSQQEFASIFKFNPDAVIYHEEEGTILNINPRFTELFGYTLEEIKGRNINEGIIFPKDKTKEESKKISKTALKKGLVKIETIRKKKDGTLFPVIISASPIIIKGKPKGIIASYTDITKEKLAEREIIKAKKEAELANRAKSAFLASMSHGIRTPMNSIISMAELMKYTSLNNEQKDYMDILKVSTDSLLDVINDVLDISKIESGHIEIEKIEFDLWELIESIGITLSAKASQKGLELLCYIRPEVPQYIMGDSSRLRQILINLAGNSLKFTDKGEIIIKAETLKREDDRVLLHFTVKDTGIGIPKEKQEKIFGSFSQVDSSTTRKYGGTGLGLSISKQLAELMGGKIWVESEVGKGSTFHFTIPSVVVEKLEEKKKEVIPSEIKNLRVLIIDDNYTNRMILREITSLWGALPKEAENGLSALKELKLSCNRGKPYQLILLDKNMPDLDGFEVAKRIREIPECKKIPIIILSSEREETDLRRVEELAISDFILKPVRRSRLYNAILKEIVSEIGETVVEKSEIESVLKNRLFKILLAEDNLLNQKLGMRLLEKQGWKVTPANNGKEVLDLLEKNRFDFILMDVQMPEMDGIEATHEIRKREKETGSHIPIIALTANAFVEDRRRCLEAGMDEYTTKPIKIKELFSIIEEIYNKLGKNKFIK